MKYDVVIVGGGSASSVVDQHCRVRGITGLWVADSSIIPQVTRANTNATAIMIGERVAAGATGLPGST